MNKALFLDRDGVVNIDHGYVHEIERFEFVDGIFELCKYFQENGYMLIIVSNQAGISKGIFPYSDLNKLTEYMINQFTQREIIITDVFYETSSDPNNYRRKPNPGMLIEAIKIYNINPLESILIGDKMTDLIAGHEAGISKLYFFQGKYEEDVVDFEYIKINQIKEIY